LRLSRWAAVSDVPRKIAEIDWTSWKPLELATLCFVVRDGRILLIRKKRGLGAGKLVGPGGRLLPGETAYECAVREVEEELRVTPTGVVARGEHDFQFTDGYAIRVFAFSADGCLGEPAETDEAAPAWHSLGAIPYDEMWEDNRVWMPLLLRGVPFSGRYVFDGDAMLDHRIERRFDPRRAHARS
jgi:8-oxo-dGTP diphosphatase